MKVSKDGGQTFYEIGDEPEQQQIAAQKGYKSYVEVSKGDQRYHIEATPEQLHIAEQKGYMLPETSRPQRSTAPYSKAVSALQGATSGMTMGFDDELSGAMSGAKAAISGKDPVQAYKAQRDVYRNAKQSAESDNPWSYAGGSLVGSAALPGGAASKGAGFAKAVMTGAGYGAAQGGVQALGDNISTKEIPGDVLNGVKRGAAFGGVAGGLGKAIMGLDKANGSRIAEAAETLPQKAVDYAKGYAKRRAINYGADEAYNAATDTDQGLPDPLRDSAKSLMQSKLGMSEGQADVARKFLPSTYDMAGKVTSGLSKVYDNQIKKGEFKPWSPDSELILSREVEHNGEKLKHVVWNDPFSGRTDHELKDAYGRVKAQLQGNLGEDRLNMKMANATTEGQGHGKKLYDLALDTHGAIDSDTSLSKLGSHKVYEKHFGEAPGVDTKLAEWGTPDKHEVRLKDPSAFQKARGLQALTPEQREMLLKMKPSSASRPTAQEIGERSLRQEELNSAARQDLRSRLPTEPTQYYIEDALRALRETREAHPAATRSRLEDIYDQHLDDMYKRKFPNGEF